MRSQEHAATGELDDEGEDDREEESLEVLASDDRTDRIEARDHHDTCADHEDHREDAVEDWRFAELLIHARLKAERFAECECRGERHDRHCKEARPKESCAEEDGGEGASEWLKCRSGLSGGADRLTTPCKRHCRCDHDADGDEVRPCRTEDGVGTRCAELLHADLLLSDR